VLDHHPDSQPVANTQALQYLELTNDQRGRFTEDQSNAGVVIAKAPHAGNWDINELNALKTAAHCEHVLAILPTGANPRRAAAGAWCIRKVALFHGAV
jgi:hypothetical protein